jgi:hypothetical protein
VVTQYFASGASAARCSSASLDASAPNRVAILEGESEWTGSAALFLTSIEEMYLLKAIGCGAIADSAMTELAACSQLRCR